VEYAYRVDGGFLHPFRRGERLVVTDPLLWLQGRHTVEVVARTQDAPGTLDPTPARVELTIDTVPPAVRLIPTADGVRAEVQDAVTPADQVQLSWSLDGGRTFGPFGQTRRVEVPEGTDVAVKARDVAGNVAMDSLISGVVIVEDQAQGGCSVGSPASPALPVLGLLALLGLITLRRR
jgi:MYXO-CTERM domain-containing protein